MHFENLLNRFLEANLLLEKKEEDERVYADEISSLNEALEEEHDLRLSLEKNVESHEVSLKEVTTKLTKECDNSIAKYKLAKKKIVEFGVGHDKLCTDLEKLTEAHKALEGDHSTLLKLHEQLQIQLNQVNMPITSTSSCD